MSTGSERIDVTVRGPYSSIQLAPVSQPTYVVERKGFSSQPTRLQGVVTNELMVNLFVCHKGLSYIYLVTSSWCVGSLS